MHIPDGFLDAKTMAASAGLACAGVGWALKSAQSRITPQRMPLMGLSAAFVFAAQMLNFPVFGGTSGHLLGGVLVAVLLGPSAAVVVMTAVVMVQCLLFSDGGLLTLGANIFNMAVLAPVTGYGVYRLTRLVWSESAGIIGASAFAGWCSTVVASLACAGQLAYAGTASLGVVVPAMVHVHMVIGIGEGLITGLVLSAIMRVRPELIENCGIKEQAPRLRDTLVFGLIIALGMALFLTPMASSLPDGLETVAEHLGFAHKDVGPALHSPMADYQAPGVASSVAATALAGAVGTLVAFGLAWTLGCMLRPKIRSTAVSSTTIG